MLNTLRLCTFFFLVLVQDGLEDFFSLLFAIIEAVVVCADDDDTEVDCEVANVDMEDELFGDAWDADRGPCFSAVLHARIGVDIVHQDLNVGCLHLSNLLWVCENGNGVHRAH